MPNVAEGYSQTGVPRPLDEVSARRRYRTQLLSQSAALYDQISHNVDHLMTSIDCGRPREKPPGLLYEPPPGFLPPPTVPTPSGSPSLEGRKKRYRKDHHHATVLASSVVSESYFAKVELYANSRLPMNLSPFQPCLPTYTLLSLAAQYSEQVYDKPQGAERETYIDADWKAGTKAMALKSVPMDHINTIVIAIRGTASFMDWAVNIDTAPASPLGFLDDPGNLCHSGFLSVARRMVGEVACYLRQILQENPDRSGYSLLITGHSAGGAVAALLYSHMIAASKAAESELNILASFFRHIHCVTFGAPPLSILPLSKPDDPLRPQLSNSLFLAFVNEGDPVPRADKAYVRSLIDLLAAPAPAALAGHHGPGSKTGGNYRSKEMTKLFRSSMPQGTTSPMAYGAPRPPGPVWKVTPWVSDDTVNEILNAGVIAQMTSDQELRGMIWGAPVCHEMRLYAGRIEMLAAGAVTMQGY